MPELLIAGLAAAAQGVLEVTLEPLMAAQGALEFLHQLQAAQYLVLEAVVVVGSLQAAAGLQRLAAAQVAQVAHRKTAVRVQQTLAVAVVAQVELVQAFKTAATAAPALSSSATQARLVALAAPSRNRAASPSTPSHRPAPSQLKDIT